MLRILKSIMMIAIVSAVAVGATGAYFTDQDTVSANTFASGTIDLDVAPQTAGINVANATPGQWYKSARLDVENNSTFTESLKWKVSGKYISETLTGYYNNLNVRVYVSGLGYDGSPKTAPDGTTINAQYVWNGKIKDLNYRFKDIAKNQNARVWLFVQLDPSANNDFQGKSATFDLIFDSTQTSNSDWTQ